MADSADEQIAKQQRSRLVDHFKRVYQIVVGLAITEAVRRLSSSFVFPVNTPLWMFATFLITVVPIFHGGDRSLDLKYLDAAQTTFWERFNYVWDVYMLVITATLFVAIAEKIPKDVGIKASGAVPFYRAMAAMLIFDVAVLIIDWLKTAPAKREKLAPYGSWVMVNAVLGFVCALIGFIATPKDDTHFALCAWTSPSLSTVAAIVAAFALARTAYDYYAGRTFLFP